MYGVIKLQEKIFQILGYSSEDIHERFGQILESFEYGAPPHGGIALGFDRLVAMFAGTDSIRDVIAFPKNNAGRDVMIDSPSAARALASLFSLKIGSLPSRS
jgi:aspartyl-tRNA synthetase